MLEIVLMNLESGIEMVLMRGRLWWDRKEGSPAKRPRQSFRQPLNSHALSITNATISISLDLGSITDQGQEESIVLAQKGTSCNISGRCFDQSQLASIG